MLQKLFHRFIRPRHYWRDVGFDELSELYVSMLFRSIGMSLVGIFIPVYLYSLGVSIVDIFVFYAIVFAAEAAAAPWVAFIIARVGPKHTMAYSYIIKLISLGLLTALPILASPLWLIAITIGLANVFFFLAFHVDFSKVKHSDHGGKELGWLYIMERMGTVAGPIVGGLVAFFFGPQYTFLAAMALFAAGVVPLFLTAEPVRLNQKLAFEKLKVGELKRTIVSSCAFNIDTATSMVVWPMFAGIFIFSDSPYVKLGAITSIGVVISILSARTIGAMIDKKKGRVLLRFGAVLGAVIHLFRSAANGFVPALAVNMSGEITSSAFRMPYLKGMYDEADEREGMRIVYFTVLEVFTTSMRAVFYAFAALLALLWDGKNVFYILFILAAIASLLIMTERFRALKPR